MGITFAKCTYGIKAIPQLYKSNKYLYGVSGTYLKAASCVLGVSVVGDTHGPMAMSAVPSSGILGYNTSAPSCDNPKPSGFYCECIFGHLHFSLNIQHNSHRVREAR